MYSCSIIKNSCACITSTAIANEVKRRKKAAGSKGGDETHARSRSATPRSIQSQSPSQRSSSVPTVTDAPNTDVEGTDTIAASEMEDHVDMD